MSVHLEQIKIVCILKQQLADITLLKAKQGQEAVKSISLNRNDKKSIDQPVVMEIRKRQNIQQQQQQEINYNKFKTIVSLNKNQQNKIEQQQKKIQRNLNNHHLLLGNVEEEEEEEEEEDEEENEDENVDDENEQNVVKTDVPQTPFLTNEVSNITNKILETAATKRVYFDLPEMQHNKELILSKNQQVQQQKQQKLQSKQRTAKNIIFNGTFPIDLPLQSRFKTTTTTTTTTRNEYDAEANASVAELKYAQSINDYDLAETVEDSDDDLYEIEEEEDEEEELDGILKELGILKSHNKRKKYLTNSDEHHHAIWSMQELIANPSIPLNYQKMCSEVEHSLSNFEKYLDAKSTFKCKKSKTVRTFAIDGPLNLDNVDKKEI